MAMKIDEEKAAESAERFRSIVARYRKAKGLSTRELAESIGISPAHANYLETGHRAPSLEVVHAYARVLRVRPSRLLFSR